MMFWKNIKLNICSDAARHVATNCSLSIVNYPLSIIHYPLSIVNWLMQVPDVGERIAQSVVQFFAHPNNQALVRTLAEAGLQMRMPEPDANSSTKTSNELKGLSVVVSGTFSRISRDELKQLIAQHGGRCVSGISSSTSMLVAGDRMGPAKLQKATQLGIRIVSEDELFALLGQDG